MTYMQATDNSYKAVRVCVIGGGAAGLGLGDAIVKFAQKIDAAIGCSFMGLSAVPQENENFLGMQGMHGHYASSMAQNEADLILAVGVRFSDRATGNVSKFAKKAQIIQLMIQLRL